MKQSREMDLHSLSEQVKKECDRLDWDKIALKMAQVYEDVLS